MLALLLVACGDKKHDHPKSSASDDPWANPQPRPPDPPPRPRTLSLDGAIEGASKELLATPLSGYANAKVGDWRAFRRVTEGNLGTFHATALATVIAVTPETVTVELRGRLDETGEQRSDGADEFPRAFTVEHEIHRIHGDWTASKVEVSDTTREIDGRRFPAKRIAFTSKDPVMPAKTVRVEVWLSSEVPVGGEIAVRELQMTDALTIKMTSDVIGFGDATRTLWGTRPDL